jgi:hypothetical protein
MKNPKRRGFTLIELIIVVFLFFMINPVIGYFCWPYTVNTWLVYTGKVAALKGWHGALMAFVPGIGQLCIPLAILTWIIMMFIS